jgi:RNA polymerase sigma-70 factor (ECF subfamily)
MRSRPAKLTQARGSPEFAAVALGALSSVYNFAYRLVGNEADAEDLVQDTYVEAFRHAGQLRNLARCRAWLFRILRNRHVSRERMRRARPPLIVLESQWTVRVLSVNSRRLLPTATKSASATW